MARSPRPGRISPLLVIAEGVGQGASRHTHYDMAEAFKSVTKWSGKVDRRSGARLRAPRLHPAPLGRPGPVLLIIPRDLGEYEEDEHPTRR
jgi:thiamine pyrophosphate-dependent acetolactate synthase large subunit-like protein